MTADVIKTIYRESPESWRRALTIAGAAGIANAGILAIINRGAALASTDSTLLSLRLLLLFGLCMLGFYVGKRYALIRASVIVEHMVRNRLVRVIDKIRHADLELVERLGKGELFTKINQDTSLVSQSGLILINAAQQAFVLVFCLFYIAWLSRPAFLVTVVTIAIGSVVYARHTQRMSQLLAKLTMAQSEQVDALGHLIDGFKEIRLNRRKSDSVFRVFGSITERVRELKIDAQVGFCVDIMFSDIFFYTLLSIVVFLLPRWSPAYGAVVLMTTAAILFIIGPLQMVVQAAPVFERAKNAMANLYDLERRIETGLSESVDLQDRPAPSFQNFQSIAIEAATYTYPAREGDGTAFSIGPLNLQIARGEIVFIVGGNGSGKTTALKVLTGLYLPQRGGVRVDHELMDGHRILGYRELFSTVFSEFHLFDRLYGLEDVDEEKVAAVLQELELTDKTRFEGGRFTDLNLSTGQRKRLALAVCLLEDREVLVFDEWAADQDPHFRQYFYERVLGRLKAQGKTVIAATHDDRYWHVADRVVRMEYGAVIDEARQ